VESGSSSASVDACVEACVDACVDAVVRVRVVVSGARIGGACTIFGVVVVVVSAAAFLGRKEQLPVVGAPQHRWGDGGASDVGNAGRSGWRAGCLARRNRYTGHGEEHETERRSVSHGRVSGHKGEMCDRATGSSRLCRRGDQGLSKGARRQEDTATKNPAFLRGYLVGATGFEPVTPTV